MYKSFKHWILTNQKKIYLLAFIVIVGCFGLLIIRSRNSTKTTTGQWHRVVQGSQEFVDTVELSDYSQTDIKSIRLSMSALKREVQDVAYQTSVTSRLFSEPKNDQLVATSADAYLDYLDALSAQLSNLDPSNPIKNIVDSEGIQILTTKEDIVKDAYYNLEPYLRRPDLLPDAVFDVDQYIISANDYFAQKNAAAVAAKEAKAKQEQEAAERDQATKAAVEAVVERYLNAIKDGDVDNVEASITTGYSREFNFDNLSGEYYRHYHLTYFRINDFQLQDDGDWRVGVSQTYESVYESRGEEKRSENTFSSNLEVVLSDDGTYLVNRINIP